MFDGGESLDASVKGTGSKPEALGSECAPANADRTKLGPNERALREFPAVKPNGPNTGIISGPGLNTHGLIETGQRVEEAVKGLSAFEGGVGVNLLVDLGKRVEEAPGATILELAVDGLPPLLENMRDLDGSNGGAIHGPNGQIVGEPIFNRFRLVGGDSLIEREQSITKLTDGTSRQMPQVSLRKLGVLTGDFDLSAKRQVVAAKHPGTSHQSGRETLVMRITQANDPGVIGLPAIFLGNGKDSKVAGSLMAEGMGFRGDPKTRRTELRFHFGEQRSVAEGKPGVGSAGGGYRVQSFATDEFGSAVKQEPWSGIEDVHDLRMQKGPEASDASGPGVDVFGLRFEAQPEPENQADEGDASQRQDQGTDGFGRGPHYEDHEEEGLKNNDDLFKNRHYLWKERWINAANTRLSPRKVRPCLMGAKSGPEFA